MSELIDGVDRAEFEKLKTEVTELREIIALMRKHIHVFPESPGTMELRCNGIQVVPYPDPSGKMTHLRGRINMTVSSSTMGPVIYLTRPVEPGSDEDNEIRLGFDHNRGIVQIIGADQHPRVQLGVDEQDNGHAVVFSPGKIPRAVMKAMDNGGSVSTLNPEGKPRAGMVTTENGGQVHIINDEMKVIARMTSDPLGGLVSVHEPAGDARVALTPNPMGGGTIFVYEQANQIGAMLSTGIMNLLQLRGGQQPDITEKNCGGVTLYGTEAGGSIAMRDVKGAEVIRLNTLATGGAVEVFSASLESRIGLHGGDNQSLISVHHPDTEGGVTITTDENGGSIQVAAADGIGAALLHCNEISPAFVLLDKASGRVPFQVSYDSEQRAALQMQNADNSHAVTIFAHEHGGNLQLNGADGLIQLGMAAGEEGGRLTAFSELGIERATLTSKLDGGVLKLKWGGVDGACAMATELGGIVLVKDPDGNTVASMPKREWDGQDEQID